MKLLQQQGVMPASALSATIRVKDLRLRTYIGFNPEEREKKQDIVINIEISYNIAQAVLEDCVEEATACLKSW